MIEVLEIINPILIILGLVLVIVELFTGVGSGLDLALTGLAMVLGGVVGLLSGNLWLVGIAAAAVLLIVYWLLLRAYFHSRIYGHSAHRSNIDNVAGATGKVVSKLSDDKWLVNVEGEQWSAVSESVDLGPGETVRVERVNGVILIISRLD